MYPRVAHRSCSPGVTPGPELVTTNATCRAACGGLDDHPPALAVAVQPDRTIERVVSSERFEACDCVGRLLLDRGVLPTTARLADASLVERRDRHAAVEEMLADRREEDVVVPVRRPRARMHEDCDTERLRWKPERAGKRHVAVAGGQLMSGRAGWHRVIVAAGCSSAMRRRLEETRGTALRAGPGRVPQEVDEEAEQREDQDHDDPQSLAARAEIVSPKHTNSDERPDSDPGDQADGGDEHGDGAYKPRSRLDEHFALMARGR